MTGWDHEFAVRFVNEGHFCVTDPGPLPWLERKATGRGRASARRQAPFCDDGAKQARPLRPHDRRPVQAYGPKADQHVRLREVARR
jgi:hypothetical protein